MSLMTRPMTTIHAARDGARAITPEDLWAIPRVGAPVPAPDGTWCVVPVTQWDLEKNEGRTRLYKVAVAPGPDAAPLGLTTPEASSAEPAVSPDGRTLVFTRKDAKGKPQLHVMPLDGGEPRKVTDLPLGVFDPKWLPGGEGVVFAAKLLKGHLDAAATAAELERREKDPVKAHVTEERFFRHWDQWLTTGEVPHLFRWDAASGAVTDLMPDATLWFDWMEPSGQYDLSPDGREIVFAGTFYDEAKGTPRSAIHTLPVTGGTPHCLTSDHPSNDLWPRYSPDGRAIVYGMQHEADFYADRVRMMRFDRATSRHTAIAPDWDRSPSHWTFGADGTLYLEVEDRARVAVFAWNGEPEPRPVLTGGTTSGLAWAGGRLFASRQSLALPPEAHVWVPGEAGSRAITRFTDEALGHFALGEVREMVYEGSQGAPVQMFVVLPPGHREGETRPLVQVIHGGPHGISGDVFHWRWNAHLFASPGYAVALVNFQGSTSWGQDYAASILGAWGDRPFDDVMRGTDLLVQSGLADESRMAAAGGSYGGYMAAWIAGHTGRFRCIVNHAGVYDTLSQYASDWTFGRERSFGGEPWDGLDRIDRWNPARFADGFRTPMLVLHGERDYRVPVTQGLECYGVLKAKGIPARLVYFPDENHWVLKARNSVLWYREVLGWLERWIGPGVRA